MEVNELAGASNSANVVSPDQVGVAGLDSQAFMELLIAELQNQDPLSPMGNEELLNQVAIMRNLQSNIELSDTLKAITQNQQLTSAAAFIGKTVSGSNTVRGEVTGVVDRAFVRDGQAFLGIGEQEVALNGVNSVHQ